MGTGFSLDGQAVHATPVHSLPLPPPVPGRFVPSFNGNGQYLLPRPPGSTSPRSLLSFTRASTVAKTLEDTYMLDSWARRMIILGMRDSPDLLADLRTLVGEALAKDADASKLARALRTPLNRMGEEAHARAGGLYAAEFGTATHAWCEAVDIGLCRLIDVPEMFLPWVRAHRRVLAENGLTVDQRWTERIVLNAAFGIAGTLDRLFWTADGRLFLGDIKTAKGMDFGWLYFCIQLAIYHSADYVLSEDGTTWEPMPALDPETALIMHLPSGNPDAARLVPLNMTFGRDALDAAVRVRLLRKTAEEYAQNVRYTVGSVTEEERLRREAAYLLETCRTEAEMAEVWQQYQAVWNDDLTIRGRSLLRSAPREK